MKQSTITRQSILIADDEEAIRESLTLILEDEGYLCTAVSDGDDAIDQVRIRSFDLIIMNLLMPGRKGIKLLVDLKGHAPETPVLILSSYYDAEIAAAAIKQGAEQYLLKPIDFEEFIATVRRITDRVFRP